MYPPPHMTRCRKVGRVNVSTPQASLGFFSTPEIAAAHPVPFFAKETYNRRK
jgi:hypothetical protein